MLNSHAPTIPRKRCEFVRARPRFLSFRCREGPIYCPFGLSSSVDFKAGRRLWRRCSWPYPINSILSSPGVSSIYATWRSRVRTFSQAHSNAASLQASFGASLTSRYINKACFVLLLKWAILRAIFIQQRHAVTARTVQCLRKISCTNIAIAYHRGLLHAPTGAHSLTKGKPPRSSERHGLLQEI